MAGNNGLRYDGLTPRTETNEQTTMANGGAYQLFFFLLTPEKVLVIFVLVIGTIFVNRVRSFLLIIIYCSKFYIFFLIVKLSFSEQEALKYFFSD